MKNQKGFTLIELLVVIAIIGLLSTMAVVSLNSARGKARDAKRVSDVKQLSNLIEMSAANTASGGYKGILPANCATAGDATGDCGTFEGVNWYTIKDPSTTATTACSTGTNDICDYTMSVTNSSTDSYGICFYLEEGAGGLAAGLNTIGPGGTITAGCVLP